MTPAAGTARIAATVLIEIEVIVLLIPLTNCW
jgi:hypothetical protein